MEQLHNTIQCNLNNNEQTQIFIKMIELEKEKFTNEILDLEKTNKQLELINIDIHKNINSLDSNLKLLKEQCISNYQQINNNISKIVENKEIVKKFDEILKFYKRD